MRNSQLCRNCSRGKSRWSLLSGEKPLARGVMMKHLWHAGRLLRDTTLAAAIAFLSMPTSACAQLYEIESDALDTPFDRILKWSRLQEVEEYVVRDVKPFIAKFCNKKDREELYEANFICRGYICTTTRTWVYGSILTGNKSRRTWEFTVNLYPKSCPKINVKFNHQLFR